MSDKKNRVLSCIQPTAEMHIGNYFGAVENWVKLQDQYECIYGIVDYHAMTMPYKPEHLRANTERMVVDLVTCGIDPEKSTLFVQSLVPEHAELTWIFNCICPIGDLNRMTQFKEKSDQLEGKTSTGFISAGLFTYPVLQTADILIYRADKVPVGKDQEQHLELSRELARRFNGQFGELFPEPQPLFTLSAKIMSPADPTSKMSKSLGSRHYIGLFEDEASVRGKIKTAVTDSGVLPPDVDVSPGVANLLEILRACGKLETMTSMRQDYIDQKLKYVDLKHAAADSLVELTSQLREKRAEVTANLKSVMEQVRESSNKAQIIARETIREVRILTGLPERSY